MFSINDLPWENEEFLANYFAQTYYYVKHSEKLLALCISRLDDEGLIKRFKEHMAEENSHEKLALADLKKLGKKIEDYPEHPLTSSFYESQYYKIEHQHPLVLMGYIQYLETLAAKIGLDIYHQIESGAGVKSSFLKVHGEEDISHVQKANELINKLPMDLQELIKVNASQSEYIFLQLLKAMAVEATQKQGQTAKVAA
ncbi:iron-containing redox enzyme family protein [Bacteriovorax sp. DB6_IX]|uniref:iron-containing redox enzyme family protein n=1 Tax=Bacteriovorax sp. DB6_IX TaxID=1353530 RepID=UPI00038A2DCB|nr:iron-containing redox enzyme family protein [Bacteriovorax sp. DB6_IX]EQC50428.1 hypothetical protein M901_1500 [Bacteriovorax sp. DB6_IX]